MGAVSRVMTMRCAHADSPYMDTVKDYRSPEIQGQSIARVWRMYNTSRKDGKPIVHYPKSALTAKNLAAGNTNERQDKTGGCYLARSWASLTKVEWRDQTVGKP